MMMGYDPDSFWEQTPRTLSLAFDAHNEMQIKDHNDRAWLAWHSAGLGRAKRMPPLSRLQIDQQQLKKHHRKMEEQIEGLIKWVRATGGTVIYNG